MKKRPRDPNQLAKSIIGIATDEGSKKEPKPTLAKPRKRKTKNAK